MWTANEAQYYLARSALAHNILETYLKVSSNTYALFKQFGDSLLIKNAPGNAAQETALLQTLETDLKDLREKIEAEFKYETDDEKPDPSGDLKYLAQIETQLRQIVAEYKEVKSLKDAGRRTQATTKLAGVLEQSVDQNFRTLLSQAIEAERGDTERADKEAASALAILSAATRLLLALSVLSALTALYFLRRQVEEPLRKLAEGTEALAHGDLAHRITITGHDEFANLAARFNSMAGDLEASRSELEKSKLDLETAMAERTEKLNAITAAFENADQVRRRFLADISHELRTPLTVIRGEAEVALRGGEMAAQEYRSTLERIVEQAAHTATLVDDLLFIARRDAAQARLEKKPVAILEFLERLGPDFSALGQDRGVTVDMKLMSGPSIVFGDVVRLRQLLLIVIDNAIKYSLPASSVKILGYAEADKAIIKIMDYGIGIARDELPRVFERHFRGTNASRLSIIGSGLGLPMAKAIVEAHGGTIDIVSESQKGTTVTLSFPFGRDAEAAA